MKIRQTTELSKDAKVNGQMYVIAAVKIQLCSILSVAMRINMVTIKSLVSLIQRGNEIYEESIITMLFESEPLELCPGLKYHAKAPEKLRFNSSIPVDPPEYNEMLEVDESFELEAWAPPAARKLVEVASKLFGSEIDLKFT